MLQGRIRSRGQGKACEWKALTQEGTQGKKTEKPVAPHLLLVSVRFLLSEFRVKILIVLKFKWGQSVAWLILVEIVHPQFLPVFSGSIIISQIYTRVAV
jgi:hypothetical protein